MGAILNILETLIGKVDELGMEAVAVTLDIPQGILKQFVSGKKAPGLATCQKVIDLWTPEPTQTLDENLSKMLEAQKPDGSEMKITESDGCTNVSYCPPEWGTKKAAWEGRDVCLCLPVYKNVPSASFFSFMALAMKYRQALRMEFRGDDSMITRSRNHLAKRFLDTGATWSVWLDSDMVFPMGHAGIFMTMTNMRQIGEQFLSTHVIERLISWDRSVVGGCYWDRRGGGKLIAGANQPIMQSIPSNNLQAVGFVGTGCLAVKRQVFLDIATTFPETFSGDKLGNECGFFTNIQTPERMLGEDESFAKRATDSGHPSYLDLGLLNGHIGEAVVHGIPAGGSKV